MWKTRVFGAPGLTAGALAALANLIAPVDAMAGTDTGTMTVTVTVSDVCAVDGGTLDFGTYSGGQSAALDAAGAIAYVGCSAGTLTFALDGGGSGNVDGRNLTNGSGNSLIYQLYRNSGRTQVWGEGSRALSLQLLVSGSGSIPVYGRIPGGQQAASGNYSDSVNVTLTF